MKFKFGDAVKVINGFYQGIEGHVTDYRQNPLEGYYDSYYFEGRYNTTEYCFREVKTWINEKELEKIPDIE